MATAAAPLFGGALTPAAALWGTAAGVTGGVAVWWFYRALADGPMSVVSPLTAVLVAGIPVLVGLVVGERPGSLALAGIALALAAVVMVSRETADAAGTAVDGHRARFTPAVAWLTVGSGIAFALSFVSLHRIGDESGLWPLALSRASATVVVWLVAVGARQFVRPPREVVAFAVGIAVLDLVANGAMLYAFAGSMLSLVSVIGSLYPAATVLLAMTLLGERIGRTQQVGMGLALAAVALIALA